MTWICPNKVASIPKERIQVFLDNDEYFKRKATFADEEGHVRRQ
jgi:starch synthase